MYSDNSQALRDTLIQPASMHDSIPAPHYIYCAGDTELSVQEGTVQFSKGWSSEGPKSDYLRAGTSFLALWHGYLQLAPGLHQFTGYSDKGSLKVSIRGEGGRSIMLQDTQRGGTITQAVQVEEGDQGHVLLAVALHDVDGGVSGRVEFLIEALEGCGEGVVHGDTDTRTMFSTSEVDGDSGGCEQEVQGRTCENGLWSAWSGTFQHTSCGSSCAPGCFSAMRVDDVCQPECNNLACNWDNSVCQVAILSDAYSAKWMAYTNKKNQSIQLLGEICSPDRLQIGDPVQRLVCAPNFPMIY